MTSLLPYATQPDRHAGLRRIAVIVALLLAVIGVIGPRWGGGEAEGVAVGRDVVLVIDLSRSMLAEDMNDRTSPSRWQAAVNGARDLVTGLRRSGGHRLGVVIFAARPFAVVPLTTDLDHVLAKLDEFNASHPPAEIIAHVETIPSGTRIGAALRAAVEVHDNRFTSFQDMILFTDADDPARDDDWKSGVTAARNAGIPVHVVGLGDPERDSFIVVKGDAIEGIGPDGVRAQVQTRLHEEIAKAIAEESKSAYLPARTSLPKMDDFFKSTIESNATRELDDDRRPRKRLQSPWFFGTAVLLLAFAWWKRL